MAKEPEKLVEQSEGGDGGGFRTSRRTFLKGMGIAAGATMLIPEQAPAQEQEAKPETPGLKEYGRKTTTISLNINGKKRRLNVEPRTTLLDALRLQLDLTGSKEICDRGACSGCTVLMDGRAVTSCMMLAMDAQGHEIMTAEGMAKDPRYKNIFEAYYEHDAAQCGYCIPGFVVRTAAFLKEVPNPTREQIAEGMAGNVCRCGTYAKIAEAIEAAAAKGGVR